MALIPEPTTTAIGVAGLAWTTGAGVGIDVTQALTGGGTWGDAAFSAGTAVVTAGVGKAVASSAGAAAKYSFKAGRYYTVQPSGMWRFIKTDVGIAGSQAAGMFSAGGFIGNELREQNQ